ncbi:MAG: alanine racemase [Verrucomicrobia bacterium]|nr:MAG: alanine racemase [Verrucomicrobiota bacterium]
MNADTPLPTRCWAEIDLAALERNLKHIRAALPEDIRYVAVVKADAYGHGLHPTVARLMHSGADMFAVANIAEAAAVREIGPGWPILVLGPLLPEEMRFVLEYEVIATVSSLAEVQRLDTLGGRAGKPINVHLKIDTGMGRAGVWHTEAAGLYRAILAARHVRLRGIFTHFSSADSDPAFTEHQRQLFLDVLTDLGVFSRTDLMIHADNSAGLESFAPESPFNAVRVGLLQFGILPYENSLLARVEPEPVFSFHTRVGLVKTVPPGTGISYGRTFVTRRPTRLAVLTAGYGDGIPRCCGNRAQVLIRGRACPVLGRVTMDQTIVDVTDAPDVEVGDEVVLVGRQGDAEISIARFSRWADTIPWETLTSITKRVPRIYRTGLGL